MKTKNVYEDFSENWIAFGLSSMSLFYKFGFQDGFLIPDFIERILGIEDDDNLGNSYYDYIIEKIEEFSEEVPSLVNEILDTYKLKFLEREKFDISFLDFLIQKYLLPKIEPAIKYTRYATHNPIRATEGSKEEDYSYIEIDISYITFLEELKNFH